MTCRLRLAHARQGNSRGEASCLTAQAQGCKCAAKPQQGGWYYGPTKILEECRSCSSYTLTFHSCIQQYPTYSSSMLGYMTCEVQQCEPSLAAMCRACLQMAQDLLQSLCSANSLSSHSAILSFIKVCSRHAQTSC